MRSKSGLLILLVAASVLAPGPARAAGSASGVDCTSAYFIGLAGSGEPSDANAPGEKYNGLGQELNFEYQKLAASMPAGSTIRSDAINYSPASVNSLFHIKPGDNAAAYWSSIQRGKDLLVQHLRAYVRLCPTAKVILAGYSQGAMAVHEAFNGLVESNDFTVPHVAGVSLLADPDRVKNSKARHLGTASRAAVGVQGSILGVYVKDVDKPAITFDICDGGDLVCDSYQGLKSFNRGKAVHITYLARPQGQADLTSAAAGLLGLLKLPTNPPNQGQLVLQQVAAPGISGYGLASPDGKKVWGTAYSTAPNSLLSVSLQTASVGRDPWVAGVAEGSERIVSTPDGALWYSGAQLMRRDPNGTWRSTVNLPFTYLAAAPDSSVWAISGDSDLYQIKSDGSVIPHPRKYASAVQTLAVAPDGTAWSVQRTSSQPTDMYSFVGYKPDGSIADFAFPYSTDPTGGGVRPVEIYSRPDSSLWWLAEDKSGSFGDIIGTMSPAGIFGNTTQKLPGYPGATGLMTVDNSGRLWGCLQTYDQQGSPNTTTVVVGSTVTTVGDSQLKNVGFGVNLRDGRLAFVAPNASIVVVRSGALP